MRHLLTFAAASALIAVAACNQEAETPPPSSNESAAVGEGEGPPPATGDVAAIMHERHENYEAMGKAMKGLGDELKASQPSMETIQRHADVFARFAPQIPTWFPQGSGPEAGETRAKAEVWSDWRTFRTRAAEFEQQAQRFQAAAQSGDLAAVQAAVPDLRESCKNCHDRFRAPED